MNQFDVPVLLILYICGFNWRKATAFSLIMHVFVRSFGHCLFMMMKWIYPSPQTQSQFIATQTFPIFFCYIGELFIDSYMIHKVRAIRQNIGRKYHVCLGLYLILVALKLLNTPLRIYYGVTYGSSYEYNYMLNRMDVVNFSVAAVMDFTCCIVLVQELQKIPKTKKTGLAKQLQTQTEYRMFLTNLIQIGAAAVIASQDCYGPAEQFCAFAGARDIVNVNVYLMYYLDFLIIQFSSKTAQHMAAPLRKKTGTSPRPSGANVKSPTTDVSIAKSPMDDQ